MPLSKSVPFPTQPAGAGERGFAFLEGQGRFHISEANIALDGGNGYFGRSRPV
jgi:hypothetical protein